MPDHLARGRCVIACGSIPALPGMTSFSGTLFYFDGFHAMGSITTMALSPQPNSVFVAVASSLTLLP